AALGLAGWLALSTPVLATVCVVVADLAGALLMLPKMWRDPDSETASSFLLAGIAGGLGAAAVGSLQPDLLLYPVYFGAVNAAIAVIIVLRRKHVDRPRPDQRRGERRGGVDHVGASSGHVNERWVNVPRSAARIEV